MYDIKKFITKEEAVPSVLEEIFTGEPWEVLRKTRELLEHFPFEDDAKIVIGNNCRIDSSAVIEGPVIIGDNCEIGTHVHIRPYSIIGNGCHIGHGSEVKASIMCCGSKVASLAFLGDSILGFKARVGSGVITANRNFSQDEIIVKDPDGFKRGIGQDFFGCILGDNSRHGANSTTQPGTLIMPYCWVLPGTVARGFVPEAQRVYNPKPLCFSDNERIELS